MEDWIIPLVGFVSAFISSAVGFGGAMVMAPLLFFVLPPPQAVITTAILASTTNLLIVTEKRKKSFEKKELYKLAIGTIPGMIIGILLLETISTSAALIITGFAILFGVALRLFLGQKIARLPDTAAYGIGLGSGALATTTGLAALAPAWFVIKNTKAESVRDSLNLYYLFTGLGTFILGVAVIGLQSSLPPWQYIFGGIIAVLIGHSLGKIIFAKLSKSHERYKKIAIGLLVVISLIAISRGILYIL